jgi:nucleoid-associated protein YgaU
VIISIYSATVESRLQHEQTGSAADESNKKNEPKSETDAKIPPPPVAPQNDRQSSSAEQADKNTENVSGNVLIHTVAPGETLSAISTLYYGTIDQQQKILDANADSITNANRLRPGMRLIIP